MSLLGKTFSMGMSCMSSGVWLGAERKCSATVVTLDLLLLPGPSRRLAPVIKCRQFLSFFQRYIVRDISLARYNFESDFEYSIMSLIAQN